MSITDLSYCEQVRDSEISGGFSFTLSSLSDFWKSYGVEVPYDVSVEKLGEWYSDNGYGSTYGVSSTSLSGSYAGLFSFMSVYS
jgi:hypothetical protein